MTFRGTYRNGVIIPEEGATLQEGDTVEIQVRSRRATTPKKARSGLGGPRKCRTSKAAKKLNASKRMTGKQRLELFLQSFGMWKDKPEWKGRSSADIAREIRSRASRGTPRG
ncbi:MAG TPA: antitoxin AF2212-like protein [Phycisphaerales bacterium]|nr:antitoxin AF2212-like protein [Phycisphaerales bacterium]